MPNLTPRQSQVLAYLRDYRKEHGYAPTQMEIGDQLAMGKVTAHQHLNELERKGCLRRDKHKARGIELTRGGVLALAVASPCPKEAAIREAVAYLGNLSLLDPRKYPGAFSVGVEHVRAQLLAAIGGKP